MRAALKVIGLEELGMVRLRGADAVKFLQGQLSNDVARVSAQRSLLAGYHNPQGRTIALLRLVQWDADDILAVLPRELAAGVASRLGKFVLRAKVKVVDESAAWRVQGLVGATANGELHDSADAAAAGSGGAQRGLMPSDLPTVVGAQARVNGAVFVCVSDQPPRWIAISPVDAPSPVLDYPAADFATWQRLEVAAGQPQVYAATSEEFVAQMLNLDALNAIAFDKGCYTGQEVIARAHYRGRVKRRMQRFVSREPCRLSPGDSGQLADGRTFKVVVAAQLADGRCDFLAVAPMLGAPSETGAASAAAGSDRGATAGVTTQAVHPEAPPTTDPTAPPVAGPIMDPTLAPIAAATVAPTVAAAAALLTATSGAAAPAAASSGAVSGATGDATVIADQAELPYPLPT
ncbi:MAG TPA: hypothetical protein VNO35_01685 [Steroidobacteraceae bacterium]|nr:hypothetical protein [Steroidobacteraceae bacterium]